MESARDLIWEKDEVVGGPLNSANGSIIVVVEEFGGSGFAIEEVDLELTTIEEQMNIYI